MSRTVLASITLLGVAIGGFWSMSTAICVSAEAST